MQICKIVTDRHNFCHTKPLKIDVIQLKWNCQINNKWWVAWMDGVLHKFCNFHTGSTFRHKTQSPWQYICVYDIHSLPIWSTLDKLIKYSNQITWASSSSSPPTFATWAGVEELVNIRIHMYMNKSN